MIKKKKFKQPSQMRIIFMGTPDFAVPAFLALTQHYEVIAVYTQPPRSKGRGYEVQKTPVHQAAEERGIPVYTPINFKSVEDQLLFHSHKADLAIVAAYGLILPQAILDSPKHGCWNIHASLLPRWRGASPIQQAILHQDAETGITMMQMDAGLDTGPMISQHSYDLTETTTFETALKDLSDLGSIALLRALEKLTQQGFIDTTIQSLEGVTYAPKIKKEESFLDWALCTAFFLDAKIRAFNPSPGTYFVYQEERIKILSSEVVILNHRAEPGTVYHLENQRVAIACLEGWLTPTVLQRPGRKPQTIQEFLRGFLMPERV